MIRLPPRQREVAELVADGLSNRQIARRLGISHYTVESHVRQISHQLPGQGPPRVKITRYVALHLTART